MIETVFFLSLIVISILVFKYLKSLDHVSNIGSCSNELDKLTIGSREPNKYALLRDFRFILSILTGSYRKKVNSVELLAALDESRKYLLLQYPLAIFIFLLPLISKLL